METLPPRWTSWTFLVYAGGFVTLASALAWLGYFSARYGTGGTTAWALVVFAVLVLLTVLLRRLRSRIASGVLAFVAAIGFFAFAGFLWSWFGWLGTESSSSLLHGFHFGRLSLELVWLIAALVALRLAAFPLLMAEVAFLTWLFVTDLLSGGGAWTALLTLLIGIAFLGIALLLELGSTRPYAFWLHVAAGLAIGGAILYLLLSAWNAGNVEWALVVVVALAYIWLAATFDRSSWAVLGVFGGLLPAAAHFSAEWSHVQVSVFSFGSGSSSGWAPALVLYITGLLIVALGLLLKRRAPATAA